MTDKPKPITSSFEIDQFISDRWNTSSPGGKQWTDERMKNALCSHFHISPKQAAKDVAAFAAWEKENVLP